MANGPTLPPQAYTREILTSAFNWLQSQPESVRKIATTPDALVGLYLRAQRYGNSSLEADAPISSQSFISDLKNLAEGLKQFEGPRDARRNSSATSSFAASSSSASATLSGISSSNMGTATMTATRSSTASSLQGRLFPPVTATSLVPTSPTPPSMPTPPAMPVPPTIPVMAATRDVEPVTEIMATGAFHSAASRTHAIANAASQAASAASSVSSTPASPAPAPASPSAGGTTVTSVSTHTSTTSVATTSVMSPDASSQISGQLNARTLDLIQEVKGALNLSSDAEAINMMVSIAYKHLKSLLP